MPYWYFLPFSYSGVHMRLDLWKTTGVKVWESQYLGFAILWQGTCFARSNRPYSLSTITTYPQITNTHGGIHCKRLLQSLLPYRHHYKEAGHLVRSFVWSSTWAMPLPRYSTCQQNPSSMVSRYMLTVVPLQDTFMHSKFMHARIAWMVSALPKL